MPKNLLDDFLDGLRDVATQFATDFVRDRIGGPAPQPQRARRVNGKPPKAAKVPRQPKARKETGPTLYDVLQIARSADAEVVTAAWKSKCRKFHPDTGHGNAKKMAEVNAVYEILKDPIKRREYDRSLRG